MKHITIEIPDNKYSFLMELLTNLSFVKVKSADILIPEEHKNVVRERVAATKENPSRLLEWDTAKMTIKT